MCADINIADPEDPRLATFRDLRTPADRESVIVEGEVAVHRFLGSGYTTDTVLATPTYAERLGPHIRAPTRLYVAEANVIRAVAGFDFHRGCLASGPRPPQSLEIPDAVRSGLWVVAEGLADPSNLGAIARNVRALGAAGLVVSSTGADPFSRRAIRASMGHVFTIPLFRIAGLTEQIARVRETDETTVIAATPSPAATSLPEFEAPANCVVLVGNEGDGLSPALLAQANLHVRIPVAAGSDSLNVAAATAVLLYALR